MRKRINFQLLKHCQQKVQSSASLYIVNNQNNNVNQNNKNNTLQQQLYSASYQLINDLLCDIKRPFKNICIHGYQAHQVIGYLNKHYQLNKIATQNQNIQKQQQQKPKLTIVDYLDLIDSPQSFIQHTNSNNHSNIINNDNQNNNNPNNFYQITIHKLQSNDAFVDQQQQFDLIISALELNHCNNEEKLLQKYLRTLKPDGALIGCAMVEGTLSELHWAYLMAENQRHGGLSPKVLQFPSLGQLGNLLTQSHYHLATVLNRDYHLQLQSPLQVMKMIQLLGENMHLKGRRKGVYKQLLVAMYAMYQSQFQFEGDVVKGMLADGQNTVDGLANKGQSIVKSSGEYLSNKSSNVLATLVLSPFVGWKYAPNQPKPLRRGQHGQSIDFVDELRKYDPDLQHYKITEENDQPQEIKSKSAVLNKIQEKDISNDRKQKQQQQSSQKQQQQQKEINKNNKNEQIK